MSKGYTLQNNSGLVDVASGGTNQSSYTDGQLLIGNTATGGLNKATITAGANITVTNGNGTISIAAAGGAAGVTSINADATAAQLLTVGTTGTDFAIVDAGGGSHVFNLPDATAAHRGALISADWTTFNGKQAGNASLTALAALGGNGLVAQTGANTFSNRTATGTANRLSISNGDGVAGNPTFDISATYVGQASITTLGTIATGTWTGTTVAVANGGTGVTTSTGTTNVVLSNSPTIVTPTIASFTNATHNHQNAAGGGTLDVAAIASGTLSNARGGTGATSYTDGQLLIGSSADNLLHKATITAGTGVTVTNGNGTITVAATGGGAASRNFDVIAGDGNANQVVAHGLTGTPTYVRFTAEQDNAALPGTQSIGSTDGTNNKCVYQGTNAAVSTIVSKDATKCIKVQSSTNTAITATATMDATNITIAWSTASNTHIQFLWEAFL